MRQRAARILVLAGLAGTGVVLAAAAIMLREPLVERWQIHRFEAGDPEAREAALGWLERHGSSRAVPALLRGLERDAQAEVMTNRSPRPISNVSSSPHARALEAILHRDPGQTSIALADALTSDAASVRRFAGEAMGRLGAAAAPAVPRLLRALGRDDAIAWDAGPPILAAIGSPARPALPLLLARIESGATGSVLLARVAGQIAAAQDVPAILALLDSPQPVVRRAALWAIERMGPRAATAVPVLEGCLHDADEEVRVLADLALFSVREGRR
jgi:HEAT repeat protein